jgi:hypothetical protein
MYIEEILRRQTPDGGWNLTAGAQGPVGAGERGDSDLTGMALQALAKYQDNTEVRAATDRALAFLSGIQDEWGGFVGSFSGASSAVESVAQVLVALTELGIPIDDARFVKNGNTLLDNLLSYRLPDGGFRHSLEGGGNNQMSSEQAFYALVAAQRAAERRNSLYRMSDAVRRGDFAPLPTEPGLPGRNPDVIALPVITPGMTFADIRNHPNQAAG